MTAKSDPEIDHDEDELAALKDIALAGAFDRQITVRTEELADWLDVPQEVVPQTLQRLRDAGYLMSDDGERERVCVTDVGRVLLAREYADYCRLFDPTDSLRIMGEVTKGVGKASGFVSLQGYIEQFCERLGYEPFHGTLNITVDNESWAHSYRLEAREGIRIDEWESDGRTYGGVTCYSARVETADGRTYDPTHVIVPDRTQHDASELEILAPDKLRDELGLRDDDTVIVHLST